MQTSFKEKKNIAGLELIKLSDVYCHIDLHNQLRVLLLK